MTQNVKSVTRPNALAVVPRIAVLTVMLTLMSFAISLFLGIIGTLIVSHFRGVAPDLRMAYRVVAFPVAAVVAVAAFVAVVIHEVRYYRRAKALAEIERIS